MDHRGQDMNTDAELGRVLMRSSSTATRVRGSTVDEQLSTRLSYATCTRERSFGNCQRP